MNSSVLVEGCDDVVCGFGDGENTTSYEAVVI
jgi:hypothetical protein